MNTSHPIISEMAYVLDEALHNKTLDVCSRWAVSRRVMEDGEPYSLEDYPYIEEIINSRAQKNWVMKAAQVGLSEAAFTMSIYETEFHNKPCLYYFPTTKMAATFSKTRISNAIKLSPYLSSVCTTDSVELKQFGKATLYITGANSEASLRGTSSGRLFFDELDAWTERQIYMAEERASGQKGGDKKVWGFSTPMYPNCGVHKQYKKSTQEHYFFICPHCLERVELRWPESVLICGESVDDPDVKNSRLICYACKEELPHATKREWLRAKTQGGTGEWIATNPDADPENIRGFHISQLYSPTVEPWEIVVAYLRGHSDEAARREFHNSKLGLPFIEDAHQVNDSQIDEATKKFSLVSIPLPVQDRDGIVTLGIDQGGPLHHWAAVKWMFDPHKVGDPNDRAKGRLMGCGRILQDDWAGIHALMRTYRVWRCVIDYFPEPTNARVFARAFKDAVYLCQYVKGAAAREVRLTEDDYGAHLVRVDKTSWLSKSLGRVMVGEMELPLDLPLEFRKHLKAPVRTIKEVQGQYVAEFVETGPDHYAHALNYAEIALKILDPALNSSSILTETRS
jgi:hypothetical protein